MRLGGLFGWSRGRWWGLYSSSSATTVIVGSLIHGNVTGAGGGGVMNGPGGYGGGIASVRATGLMTITNTVVDDNLARGGGGGLYGDKAAFIIQASTFSNNDAVSGAGGAVRLVESDSLLVNSTLAGNIAPLGGGITALYSTVTMSYVTLAWNTGGSLRLESSQPGPATVIIDHSILAGPSADAICGGDGSFMSHGFNIASDGPVPGVVPAVLPPGGGASAVCSTEPTDATGIARIACAANAQAGSCSVTLQTIGASQAATSIDFTLTTLPNDRIFGTGFGGTALPTAASLS